MSHRYVSDSFWTDPYIDGLDPSEKLLFLYLLTNPLCNIAGIYEIPSKRISFETGFERDMVDKLLSRFEKDEKIIKIDDWIVIVNYTKHQVYKNPSVTKGIQRIINELPKKVQAVTGCDRLSHLTLLNLTLPNGEKSMNWNKSSDDYDQEVSIDMDTREETNTKPKPKKKTTPEMKLVFEMFDNPEKKVWHMHPVQREAAQVLYDTYGFDKLNRRMSAIKKEAKNEDPFFPVVSSPQVLLAKMPTIERYFKS